MWRRGEAGCTSTRSYDCDCRDTVYQYCASTGTRPVSLTADKHVNCSLERGGRFIAEMEGRKVGKLVLGRCA